MLLNNKIQLYNKKWSKKKNYKMSSKSCKVNQKKLKKLLMNSIL